MKKTFYTLLVVAFGLGLTACEKEDSKLKEKEEEVEIRATATMTRTLDFTILGTEKDTTYTEQTPVKATARIGDDALIMGAEKNVFLMTINAGPEGASYGEGDLVQFVIDPAKLSSSYVGIYRFDAQADLPIKHIRYGYHKSSATGGYSAILAGTNMGNTLTGELKITHYDAARNLLSGTYTITGKLYTDPTDHSRITRWENYNCDLAVSGTFANVKIKQD